jgi:hypothetical protein
MVTKLDYFGCKIKTVIMGLPTLETGFTIFITGRGILVKVIQKTERLKSVSIRYFITLCGNKPDNYEKEITILWNRGDVVITPAVYRL